jgi:hypothetical protein
MLFVSHDRTSWRAVEPRARADARTAWRDQYGGGYTEYVAQNGRTQVVQVMQGADAEQDAMVFLWSTAGDLNPMRDLTALLRFSMKLSYGCVAVRDHQIGVKHSLRMAAADEVTLRKSIFYVARAADLLEAEGSGADHH